MNKAITALVAVQVISLFAALIVAWVWHKKKHPPLCDGCKWLMTKQGGLCLSQMRYQCAHTGHFDRPPKICRSYKPMKEDTDVH